MTTETTKPNLYTIDVKLDFPEVVDELETELSYTIDVTTPSKRFSLEDVVKSESLYYDAEGDFYDDLYEQLGNGIIKAQRMAEAMGAELRHMKVYFHWKGIQSPQIWNMFAGFWNYVQYVSELSEDRASTEFMYISDNYPLIIDRASGSYVYADSHYKPTED